jgi:hypothetical protein
MSWDHKEEMPPERFWTLAFYKIDNGNGTISEEINPGKRWKLAEIRIHFSTAFASAEYLKAFLSAIKGSEHNVVLLSHNCSGSTDYILYYSEPRLFLSDDVLCIELSNASGVNAIGISVFGWAVLG